MRPLGLTDTIFFNLGNRYITVALVLEGQCDLARFCAQMEAAAETFPSLRERHVRLWPWFFAFCDRNFNIARHIVAVEDDSVRTSDDLLALIEKVRRTPTPEKAPPWRAFVVNPAAPGPGHRSRNPPLSAVMVQLKHGLADAMRCIEVGADLAARRADASGSPDSAIAHLDRECFDALPETGAVEDSGVALLRIPRARLRRDRDANARMVEAAARLLEDRELFAHPGPLNGCIARTRFLRRRAGRGELGNHMETVAERTGAPTAAGRAKPVIPGLEKVQSLPLAQILVAVAPPALARALMRLWYSRFDAIVTVLPLPPNLTLGGCRVRDVFGATPLPRSMPLMLMAFAYGGQHNVVAIARRGFTGTRRRLAARLEPLLTAPSSPWMQHEGQAAAMAAPHSAEAGA